jgi:hypothetical protein
MEAATVSTMHGDQAAARCAREPVPIAGGVARIIISNLTRLSPL